MPTGLFDAFELTKGEQEFIHNVLADDKTQLVANTYLQRAQILATLRYVKELELSNNINVTHAQELEKSSLASVRNAKAMNLLTVVLIVVTAIQAFWPIISKYANL